MFCWIKYNFDIEDKNCDWFRNWLGLSGWFGLVEWQIWCIPSASATRPAPSHPPHSLYRNATKTCSGKLRNFLKWDTYWICLANWSTLIQEHRRFLSVCGCIFGGKTVLRLIYGCFDCMQLGHLDVFFIPAALIIWGWPGQLGWKRRGWWVDWRLNSTSQATLNL